MARPYLTEYERNIVHSFVFKNLDNMQNKEMSTVLHKDHNINICSTTLRYYRRKAKDQKAKDDGQPPCKNYSKAHRIRIYLKQGLCIDEVAKKVGTKRAYVRHVICIDKTGDRNKEIKVKEKPNTLAVWKCVFPQKFGV